MIRERVRELRELPDPSERRRLRQTAGVSTIDVGRAIGVAPQTIGMWERGQRRPSARHLAAYLEVLRVLRMEVEGQ